MNKKRLIATVSAIAVFASLFAGCGASAEKKDGTKVGMVTDSGTIDDKSFNQGTWEGILKYKKDKKTIKEKYLQPSGEQKTDYLNAINDLVDAEYKIIIAPGFKFETAINEAADKYNDVKFVIIDGQPNKGDGQFVKHDNVVSIFFNEHEVAFLAGASAALSTKTGKVGFIGGMKIPPIIKFGSGYKAGVAYANKLFGTKAEVTEYVYQGTFNDAAAGQNLASGMYDKGVDIIFHAAGGVGNGVFTEAKQRAEKGKSVYVIGVDVDQYEAGKISSGKSVTLTSAMKKIDVAAYNNIDDALNNKFKGGEVLTLSLSDKGVGLPEKNPNLSKDTIKKIEQIKKDVIDKKVVVPESEEKLAEFLKKYK